MMNGCNTIHMKDMSISIYVKSKSIWKLADKLHLYYLFRTKSMCSAVLSLQEFSYINSYLKVTLLYLCTHLLCIRYVGRCLWAGLIGLVYGLGFTCTVDGSWGN